MDGKETGTLFLPLAEHLNSRKYWIAFTLRSRGRLFIDDGAKEALVQDGKSLLPSGVTQVEGDFALGDPVTCVDAAGNPIAKGLVNYSADEIRKIMGLKTREDRAGPGLQGLRRGDPPGQPGRHHPAGRQVKNLKQGESRDSRTTSFMEFRHCSPFRFHRRSHFFIPSIRRGVVLSFHSFPSSPFSQAPFLK